MLSVPSRCDIADSKFRSCARSIIISYLANMLEGPDPAILYHLTPFSLNELNVPFTHREPFTSTMASTQPRGERLVVTVIDQYAREEPERAWVSIPRTDKLSDGYVDVTYKQLANAVSHAALWLDASLGPGKDAFETFAYVGPKDLRYPVLAVAAVKVGRKVSAEHA